MAGRSNTVLAITGVLAGIALGAAFSFLLLSRNWRGHTAAVPLALLAGIGLTLGAVAAYRIRRHALGFIEGLLLGSALSIFASLALILLVVTGV